jgi:DNA polymerase III epsilon subunit-like protein
MHHTLSYLKNLIRKESVMDSLEKQLLWEKGKEILQNAPQLFIDIDIEADGIAGHGSILSIGATTVHGETFYSELKPAFEQFIEGHSVFCAEHGLERERLLAEAVEAEVVMHNFNVWIHEMMVKHEKDPVFVGLNAGFDWPFIDLYFRKYGIDNPFGIAGDDLKSLVMPLGGSWDWNDTKKSRMPEAIKPEGDFTHHALEDAQYQQKLHFGAVALFAAKLGHENFAN